MAGLERGRLWPPRDSDTIAASVEALGRDVRAGVPPGPARPA